MGAREVASASYKPLKEALEKGDFSTLERELIKLATDEGSCPSVEQIVIDIVQLIEEREAQRGPISRTARSQLSEEGKVCQAILDKLLLCLIGLAPDKAGYINARLAVML
jgi:hypothetical protein